MLFRPIKAFFNAILRMVFSGIIIIGVYLASTGHLNILINSIKNVKIQTLQQYADQSFKFIRNSGIIKIVPSDANNSTNLDKVLTQPNSNANKDLTATNTPTKNAHNNNNSSSTFYYPAKNALISISYQTVDNNTDIFKLPDYTPVKLNISLNESVTLHCKILSSKNAKALGYMYKPSIEDYECLIFTFKEPTNTPFYMKNVNFPLDIIYTNSKLKIISIINNAPPCKEQKTGNCPLYFPSKPYRIVIEMKGGNWKKFTKNSK